MDGLKLYIRTMYRDKIKRYLESLGKEDQQKLTASLYIVLTLFTIAFFGVFAINPTLSTISELQKQHEDLKKLEEDMRNKIGDLLKLGSIYQTIQPSISRLDNAIPQTPEISSFTRKIETLSEQNGLEIQRFSINTLELYPQDNKNIPLSSFTFSLVLKTDDNESIKKILSGIINFDRLVVIESITKSTAQEEKNATINGKVFYKKK